MFDFSKIEDIEMEYEYKEDKITSYYSEVNGKQSRVISPNKDVIRFTIQDEEISTDNSIYQIILKIREGEIDIKGDFFETPDEWYETSVKLTEKYALIISEDSYEKMVLKCHIA